MSDHDPFFIGWEGKPAETPIKHSKSRALLFLFCALAIAGTAAALQTNFAGKGSWDFAERTFEGVFLAEPVPCLIANHPDPESGASVYYLVLETKHGLSSDAARPHHLKRVKITGSLIHDPEQTTAMIAITGPSAITETSGTAPDPLNDGAAGDAEVTLRGEIADSKCALGAMNPGVFKVHRACAIRCISGGIPPVLIVRHVGGGATHYLLVDESGDAINNTVLENVALPVEITGRVRELGDWRILYAPPSNIRRIR